MRIAVTFELKGNLNIPGFRPFMWRYATECGLGGWISNTPEGVMMRLDGEENQIGEFIKSLPYKLHNNFRLDAIKMVKREDLAPVSAAGQSKKRQFNVTGPSNTVPIAIPDKAPCEKCLAEMLDPKSRRFAYPFSSCALCGPNYSMLSRLPFRRRNTSLSAFPSCDKCRTEKANHTDKHHYNSESLACPSCGPQLFFMDKHGELLNDIIPFCKARESLAAGEILAVQSVYGGFQLFTNAMNADAVKKLRRVKKIPDRPLCAAAKNIDVIKSYCLCSEAEEKLLKSYIAPIVVLKKRTDIPEEKKNILSLLAPDTPTLAVSLPTSATIKMIFEHDFQSCGVSHELLATCGDNWNGKAECEGAEEIFARLSVVADKFLCHDLRTGISCGSSICAVTSDGQTQVWRRARGLTPRPIETKYPMKRTCVSFGTDNKAAVSIAFSRQIVPSQYLGIIDSQFSASVLSLMSEHLSELMDTVPDVVVCDMDEKLFSSIEAAKFAEKYSLPLVTVQKHHSLALACMAENGLKEALSLVFDNGSRAPDGSTWGSELLEVRMDSFKRLASFGGTKHRTKDGFHRPAKQLVIRLAEAGIQIEDDFLERLRLDKTEAQLWLRQHEQAKESRRETHAASSLIDSMAAALGIAPSFCTYEEHCMAKLESLASGVISQINAIPEDIKRLFEFTMREEDATAYIDWSPAFRNIIGTGPLAAEKLPLAALAFHISLAESMLAMLKHASKHSAIRDVTVSGCIFMNRILSDMAVELLRKNEYNVFIHKTTPPDNSSASVGQAYSLASV